MIARWRKTLGTAAFICFCAPATMAQQRSTVVDYQRKMQESSLRQRAVEAGGRLYEVRDATPQKLFGTVASLMEASDEVLLVHVDRNASQLSPQGDHPITFYVGTVLRKWKGSSSGAVTFAVPAGTIVFDPSTRAAASIRGFRTIENGLRYLVFLKFSNTEERGLTPALRLTGDAVQGAYALEGEKISPVYHLDPIGQKYRGSSARTLLDQLDLLSDSQKKR
jgi:hypothetical protein